MSRFSTSASSVVPECTGSDSYGLRTSQRHGQASRVYKHRISGYFVPKSCGQGFRAQVATGDDQESAFAAKAGLGLEGHPSLPLHRAMRRRNVEGLASVLKAPSAQVFLVEHESTTEPYSAGRRQEGLVRAGVCATKASESLIINPARLVPDRTDVGVCFSKRGSREVEGVEDDEDMEVRTGPGSAGAGDRGREKRLTDEAMGGGGGVRASRKRRPAYSNSIPFRLVSDDLDAVFRVFQEFASKRIRPVAATNALAVEAEEKGGSWACKSGASSIRFSSMTFARAGAPADSSDGYSGKAEMKLRHSPIAPLDLMPVHSAATRLRTQHLPNEATRDIQYYHPYAQPPPPRPGLGCAVKVKVDLGTSPRLQLQALRPGADAITEERPTSAGRSGQTMTRLIHPFDVLYGLQVDSKRTHTISSLALRTIIAFDGPPYVASSPSLSYCCVNCAVLSTTRVHCRTNLDAVPQDSKGQYKIVAAPEPQRRQPRREQWEIAEHGGIVVQKENNEIRTDAGPDHVLDQRLCDVANTPPESRISLIQRSEGLTVGDWSVALRGTGLRDVSEERCPARAVIVGALALGGRADAARMAML
ncbi:hypothetical protein K525DRAFT_365780 [Schizophyllum commune Loenen D]|nr:hypothetical protein K525DRAFT_365780 [Schizophyllum commune Loenen D]